MTYTLAIFGDAGNSLTNGTSFYYSPGKWERYQIGASAPLQASVNQMMQSWNPNDLIQLGDSSYNTSSSSLLDYNIGQYYNNYMYPYAPPEFVSNSIYIQATEGGIQANSNPLSNKQWPYNLYDYPNGFRNPLNGNLPGGSSDKLNHYWIVPGNHDEATIIGSYSDSSVNQIDYDKQYIGTPQGPDAFDFANNIKPYLPNNNNNPNFNGQKAISKTGSNQAFLDYHPWLDLASTKTYTGKNQVKIGKASADGYGIYYSIDLGETVDDKGNKIPLMHYTFIDTNRLLADAGYYDFNFKSSSPTNNFLYDPTVPLGADTPAPQHQDPNQPNQKIGNEMYQWALGDLKSSKAKWNFVAGHHPGYNIGQSSELLNSKGGNTTNNSYSNIAVVLKFLAGLNTELKANGEAPFDAYFNGHSHYYGRAMETVDTGMGLGLGIPSFTIGDSGKVLDDMYPVPYGASLYNYQDDNGSNLIVTQLQEIYKHLGDTKPVSAGASGWTSKLIDTKQTLIDSNGKAYELSIPVYTNGQGQIDTTGDISGLYGYGSGAAEIKADKDYIFTHYKTVETLDPAIVRIAKEESKDYQRGSLFYERWSPTTAHLEDLALFSFNVQVDKDNPTGYLTDFTRVNAGNGYFEQSLNQATPVYENITVGFQINGNNPLNPIAFDISDPTRALVNLTFNNGQLQPINPADIIRNGSDYRNLLNAINAQNYDFTNIPSTGYKTDKPLLVGININLEAQTVFANQSSTSELYQDWYLITDTIAKTTAFSRGPFGSLEVSIQPKSKDALNIIANTPVTTGYSKIGPQQKYEQAQTGIIELVDSLNQRIGSGTINNGFSELNLTQRAAPGALSLSFSGDPNSSYLINFKPSATSLALDYGNWQGLVRANPNNSLVFKESTTLSMIRTDSNGGLVNFGLAQGITALNLLNDAAPASDKSINLMSIYNGSGWQTSEGHAVGSISSKGIKIQSGTWTPTAKREGRDLMLQNVNVTGNNITAIFEDGITGSIILPGTGTAINPSDVKPQLTVQRLGSYNNGLAFYEADSITGAVGELLPGEAGYIEAALANARGKKLLLQADQLPGFGGSSIYDSLPIQANKNYGILLLVNGSESNVFSSYSAANPGGSQQFLSFGSSDRGITVGIEDLLTSNGSDKDYNDLVVILTSASPTVIGNI